MAKTRFLLRDAILRKYPTAFDPKGHIRRCCAYPVLPASGRNGSRASTWGTPLGVHHRDLKPENILYDVQGNTLVVADFGAAEFTEDELYTVIETKPGERIANFQ